MCNICYDLVGFFNIEFTCEFSSVAHLGFIFYSSWIKLLLNAWPSNSFPWLYIIIVGFGYLHNHYLYTRLAILAFFLWLNFNVSNHPVAGSIVVKYFSMRQYPWHYIITLNDSIRSNNNLSQRVSSASFAIKLPYFLFCLFSVWQGFKTLMWVCI